MCFKDGGNSSKKMKKKFFKRVEKIIDDKIF